MLVRSIRCLKSDGSGAIKWTIDFEKINENIDPPNGWMDFVTSFTRDLDAHLVNSSLSPR